MSEIERNYSLNTFLAIACDFRFSTIFVAASTIALGACAGRAPQPVAIVQAQDQFSDCAAISAEVQANNNRISELASEKGLKVGQNVAAGVAGLFIPVLWFGMDWQGTAGRKRLRCKVASNTSLPLRCNVVPQPCRQRLITVRFAPFLSGPAAHGRRELFRIRPQVPGQ
jgi:hypothetical protein